MKQKVVHLTAKTRRCVIRLYHALDVLLCHDDSSTGLSGRSAFCYVRPYLFQMFSLLWGKDDVSLTKEVFDEFPDTSSHASVGDIPVKP